MSFNNVWLHRTTFFTKEALDEIARITIHNFDSFEDKVKSENEVAFHYKTTAELS
jgi:hypothetical protein